jgi:L-glutamine-phosphate cytidylyltransferase
MASRDSNSQHASVAIVVLAAGTGSRLGPTGADVPKWLLTVGGRPLAHWHLDAFAATADLWERLLVVVGHAASAVDACLTQRTDAQPIRVVRNPKFATRNNWYSLLLALDELEPWQGRVLVLNSDLLLPTETLERLIEFAAVTRSESFLVVDFERPLTDEAMKVAINPRGKMQDIGKTEISGEPVGEYVGLSVLGGDARQLVLSALRSFCDDAHSASAWYEAAFAVAARNGAQFALIPIGTSAWLEIDDPDDLARASVFAART